MDFIHYKKLSLTMKIYTRCIYNAKRITLIHQSSIYILYLTLPMHGCIVMLLYYYWLVGRKKYTYYIFIYIIMVNVECVHVLCF